MEVFSSVAFYLIELEAIFFFELVFLPLAFQVQVLLQVRVQVQVDTGAFRISGGYGKALPGRYQEQYRVTQKDRKIAGRLGRYTGVSKRELVQLKKQGYSWNEIGRWLGISPKVVRAAKSNHKWERFINRRHRGHYCEIGGR